MNPVFLAMILIAAARGQDAQIKCYVTVSPVPEGQPVEIVCDFPSDFMNKNQPLYVFKNGKKVVTCKPQNGSYHCNPEPRYYISGPLINGEVRLLIPQAAKQDEGNYTCHGVEFQSSPCELTVEESRFDTSCTIESKHNDTDIIFFFNKNLRLVNATIFIYKQPFDSDKNDTIVLYCLIRNRGDPKCDKNLYSFDSTRMTLHIDSTSVKDEGRYTAKVPSSSPGIFTPCDLILPSTISNKDRPCVPCTTTCPTTCPTPCPTTCPTSSGAQTEMTDWHSGMLTAILCCVIILPIVCMALCYLKPGPRNAELLSRFNALDGRFNALDGRFNTLDGRPQHNCGNAGHAGQPMIQEQAD